VTAALLGLAEERAPGSLPPRARAAAEARLARLVARAERALAPRDRGDALGRLNRLVFAEAGFRRVVEAPPPEAMLLASVLERRQGSCLGLSGLYLALGEQLELALAGVLVPGHFFVRSGGAGGGRNVELLRRGERMPDSWYREKYGVPAESSLYLRDLTPAQSIAVFRYNLANELRDKGRHERAIAVYRKVARALPGFAEAWANLGHCLQRLGRLAEAREAYHRARAAHPDLPGLSENLEALEKEAAAAPER